MSDPSEDPKSTATPRSRRGRRSRNAERAARSKPRKTPENRGLIGGHFTPLNSADMAQIDHAVREVLENIGLSEAPQFVIDQVTAHGGKLSDDGRLCFPNVLVGEALAGMSRNFTLYGQLPGHEIQMTGKRVHVGSGGAAPQVFDLETDQYRDSYLHDLYDAARIVDALDNIHFFSRSLVARDMPDDLALDVNTAYACLSGTAKHVFTQVTLPQHVPLIADMCFTIAGSRDAFLECPFLSININHVVPPLRYSEDACAVMAEAARIGIPMHANSFGQLGASSPVTIIGSVVQNVAETLAGMIFAWIINPEAKVTFGTRPMITDLRTGAMSGGSGEQALMTATATQMAHYYDLPNTTIAGATDSKIADAQSGYEKCLAVALAAQVGSNAITQSCGMQASLMGCAFESYVIDNDMLGGILRSISPLEINQTTLAISMIDDVVHGEGHFLGQQETLKRMQSDFLYPEISDRRSIQEWEEDGSKDIRELARVRAKEILASHYPRHISADIDQKLRATFDIRLPQRSMGVGSD